MQNELLNMAKKSIALKFFMEPLSNYNKACGVILNCCKHYFVISKMIEKKIRKDYKFLNFVFHLNPPLDKAQTVLLFFPNFPFCF